MGKDELLNEIRRVVRDEMRVSLHDVIASAVHGALAETLAELPLEVVRPAIADAVFAAERRIMKTLTTPRSN
jgi:hypothetical protein